MNTRSGKRKRFLSAMLICTLLSFWGSSVTLAGAVTYTYDDAGRLTGANYDNGTTISYTYDNAGNLLQRKIEASNQPTTATNIPLKAGWNLISLPLSPSDKSVEEVLKSVEGTYSVVWAYQNTVWHKYSPKQTPTGLSDITEMDAGWGYWINMTAPDNLTIQGTAPSEPIAMKKDWNLVGFNGPQPLPIATALQEIKDEVEVVWAYQNGKWLLYDPKKPVLNDLDQMAPGFGYWIRMKSEKAWTLP